MSAIIFPSSVPALATQRAFASGPVPVSYATAFELYGVLGRSKFDRYLERPLRLAKVNDLLGSMSPTGLGKPVRMCRDPNDDKFLELALAGKADALLTNDADLLVLHPFHETRILTPGGILGV